MMRTLSCYRYRIANRLHRLRRALAYATGRLSPDDAQDIILDCRDTAGWYLLMVITPDDVLARGIDLKGEGAHDLKPYLAAACGYVSRKWEAGDDYYAALDWALDQACDYANQDGIEIDEDGAEDEGVVSDPAQALEEVMTP
jgi:hypothetical protein